MSAFVRVHSVSEVLSSVVKDVDQAVSSNINGAQLLHELLSAPWLHALLKVHDSKVLQWNTNLPSVCKLTSIRCLCLQIYECLLKFQRLTPSPVLPYASGLSYEVCIHIHEHANNQFWKMIRSLRSPTGWYIAIVIARRFAASLNKVSRVWRRFQVTERATLGKLKSFTHHLGLSLLLCAKRNRTK